MSGWIALLRGINVGGAKRVAMGDLRQMFAELGYPEARTYIQSGNVVVPGSLPDESEDRLETAFRARFGFESAFVVRTLDELSAAIARNPFPDEAYETPARLLLHFFKKAVSPTAEPRGLAQERVHLSEREAYVFYPAGIADSKLVLPQVATARNWNTVLKLQEIANAFR